MSKRVEAAIALRAMSDVERSEHLAAQRRKLFDVRFQQVTGQVENIRQLRSLRREIARTLTIAAEARSAESGDVATTGVGASRSEAATGGSAEGGTGATDTDDDDEEKE